MSVSDFQQIRDRLRQLYLEDPRPWLVGFSGGKDSMLVSALVFEAALAILPAQRRKGIRLGYMGKPFGSRKAEAR